MVGRVYVSQSEFTPGVCLDVCFQLELTRPERPMLPIQSPAYGTMLVWPTSFMVKPSLISEGRNSSTPFISRSEYVGKCKSPT